MINATEKIDIENMKGKVIIKFGTPFCGPCIDLDGKLEKFSIANPNITVIKVNIDENIEIMEDLLSKGKITPFMSIPATFIFNDGKLIGNQIIGSQIDEIEKRVI